MLSKLNSKLVLVRVDQPIDKDEDGIYRQEEWQTRPPTGTVEAVADDVTFCKVGDRVFFERYTAIPTTEENLRICREHAILGTYA